MIRRLSPLILLIFFSAPGFGADFHTPRSAGLTGSGHAGPIGNDATYLNPSYISLLRTYSVSATWMFFKGDPFTSPTRDHYGRLYNFSIQDGRSELFQAGVGYTHREDAEVLTGAASRAINQRFSTGLGLKVIIPKNEVSTYYDGSVSFTGLILEWLQGSLITDNLRETEAGKLSNLYREITLGTKFNIMGITLVYLDPHFTPSLPSSEAWGYELGIEATIFSDLFFRAGYFKKSYIPFMSHYGSGWGIGAGWIGPRMTLDYGLKRVLDTTDNAFPAATSHNFSATLYF